MVGPMDVKLRRDCDGPQSQSEVFCFPRQRVIVGVKSTVGVRSPW